VSALVAHPAAVKVLEGVAWPRTKSGAVVEGSAFEAAVADGRLRMVMVPLMLSGGACCYWVAAEVAGETALMCVSPRMLRCDNLLMRKGK